MVEKRGGLIGGKGSFDADMRFGHDAISAREAPVLTFDDGPRCAIVVTRANSGGCTFLTTGEITGL